MSCYLQRLKEEEVNWACLLLSSATGYYHSLLIRIQSELNVHLATSFPFLATRRPAEESSGERRKEEHEWAVQASHKALIYLGDIGRYYVR